MVSIFVNMYRYLISWLVELVSIFHVTEFSTKYKTLFWSGIYRVSLSLLICMWLRLSFSDVNIPDHCSCTQQITLLGDSAHSLWSPGEIVTEIIKFEHIWVQSNFRWMKKGLWSVYTHQYGIVEESYSPNQTGQHYCSSIWYYMYIYICICSTMYVAAIQDQNTIPLCWCVDKIWKSNSNQTPGDVDK